VNELLTPRFWIAILLILVASVLMLTETLSPEAGIPLIMVAAAGWGLAAGKQRAANGLLLAGAPLMLGALAACSPAAAYLEADRLTYEAIAPDHRRYVDGDPALTDEQRQRRRDTLDAWRVRLDLAEGR